MNDEDGIKLTVADLMSTNGTKLNGELVHTNPAYRGAYPDQDRIPVRLKQGWNTLLIKVLQGAGGWGYYVRFVDPDDSPMRPDALTLVGEIQNELDHGV